MTSLANQLLNLKQQQNINSLSLKASKSTLLLNSHVAATTSSDIFFTMGLISYSKLLKHNANLKIQGQLIFDEQNKDINRNLLTKIQNDKLSNNLITFMIKLMPYFSNLDCQKVIQFLLHNYKINIYQPIPTALIFLQYWNSDVYIKLIKNISNKYLVTNLPFLVKLEQQDVNITFILKSITYNHKILSTIINYTHIYLKHQEDSYQTQDIQINFGEEQASLDQTILVKKDPKRFILQIFDYFMERNMTKYYKYIIQFCINIIKLKNIKKQTISIVMLLIIKLFINNAISETVMKNIIPKIIYHAIKQNNNQSAFDFILLIWQRVPNLIQSHTLSSLQSNIQFHNYLKKFKHSTHMILFDLIQRWTKGQQYIKLIQIIISLIKKDQFYHDYQNQCITHLCQLLQNFNNQKSSKIQSLVNLVTKNFSFEIAQYYTNNNIKNLSLKKQIIKSFGNLVTQTNNKLIFNFKAIKKAQKLTQKTLIEQKQQKIDEQISDQQQIAQQPTQPKKNINITKLINELQQSQTKQQSKQKILQLIQNYYNKTNNNISIEIKNKLIQISLTEFYNQNKFKIDLENKDFYLPIKYLLHQSNLHYLQEVISLVLHDINIIQDVLFRQLLRITLESISKLLSTKYKQITNFFKIFYKKMISKYIQTQTVKLSQILLKISKKIFISGKGKYQRVIRQHTCIIGSMIDSLKDKQSVNKKWILNNKLVLGHYIQMIDIFGKQNIHLINIGLIHSVSKKQLNYRHLRQIITHLILGSLHNSIQLKDLCQSIVNMLILCSKLDNRFVDINPQILQQISSVRITKSIISQLFGLVKQKFKRVMVKKIILFIRALFKHNTFKQFFKNKMTQLDNTQLQQFMVELMKLYKTFTNITSASPKLTIVKQSIIENITNLVPLEVRLQLFLPVLPNQHLYTYLAQQLEQHVPQKSKFDNLKNIMQVIPEQVSIEWVRMIHQILIREIHPSLNLMKQVLKKANLQKQNIKIFGQLVCQFAQFCPSNTIQILPKCMQIVQKCCEQGSQFSLAVLAKLVRHLKQAIDPYLHSLLIQSIKHQTQHSQIFVKQIVDHLTAPTLIRFIKQNYKQQVDAKIFSFLFKHTASKNIGSTLNKSFYGFANLTLERMLQSQDYSQEVIMALSDVFLHLSLKMNEKQLTQAIIQLVRWASIKSQKQGNLSFNFRRLILSQIFIKLSNKLQALFTHFFGYTFDFTLSDIKNIYQQYSSKKKNIKSSLKRNRQQNIDFLQLLTTSYMQISLTSLETLLSNDKQNQFMDSIKANSMSQVIVELINLIQIPSFKNILENNLKNTILLLYTSIKDDYQLKQINSQMLLFLKKKNSKITKLIFQIQESLIQSLKDRFMVLVGDLVPFLLDSSGFRQEGISTLVRTIIGKIQDLSGQQIGKFTE